MTRKIFSHFVKYKSIRPKSLFKESIQEMENTSKDKNILRLYKPKVDSDPDMIQYCAYN